MSGFRHNQMKLSACLRISLVPRLRVAHEVTGGLHLVRDLSGNQVRELAICKTAHFGTARIARRRKTFGMGAVPCNAVNIRSIEPSFQLTKLVGVILVVAKGDSELNKRNEFVTVESAKKMWQAPDITSKVLAKHAENGFAAGDDGAGNLTGS